VYVVVLEFFIKVTQVRPLFMFTTYPKVFVVLYEVLKEGDDSLVGVAINAITTLASSWECKMLLDTPSASMILNHDGKVCLSLNFKNTLNIYSSITIFTQNFN